MTRRADLDDLSALVLPWAREHKVSHGPLAAMLTELAEKLLTTSGGEAPPRPTKGIVCRGIWTHKGMKWRALWLDTEEVILQEEEAHGSVNVAEYACLMETLQWIDEHEVDVPAVYSASYVAVRWIKQRQFNTSQRCPLWIEQAAARFSVTDYPRHLVQYWNEEVWGKTPADYDVRNYKQKWDYR